jgi:Domain of unknown function (DUF1772)
MLLMLTNDLAVVLAAAFTGAAFYVTSAEQPARLGLDDKNLLAQWKSSYARGFAMQASLAAASGVLGLIAAWQARDWRWVVGAALILFNWPFTLFVMMPTNARLTATPPDMAGAASRALITTWGRLHAVRTAFGLLATVAYLAVLGR